MVPDKMSVVEAYILYNHILLLQDTPEAFKFTQIDNTADDQIIRPFHPQVTVRYPVTRLCQLIVRPPVWLITRLSLLCPCPMICWPTKTLTSQRKPIVGPLVSLVTWQGSSPVCGLLAHEDSNISKPSTDTIGDVIPGVSDTNDSSSDAILKEPGTKSMKKHSSKDNEIPNGAPAKKQKKLR